MSEYQIALEERTGTKKGVTRKLRAAGRIPAVCYGSGVEATSVQLDPHALDTLLRKSPAGLNTLIDLQGAGLDGKVVLVRELQRDPVRGEILHADLLAIDASQAIEVEVPVRIIGTPTGVALNGGILDHPLREIQVSCLPAAIPEDLPVDVAALDLGDSIHVRDLVLPQGVELVSDPDLTVVSVVAPTKVEEEVPVEAEAIEGEGEGEGEAAAPEGEEKPAAEESSEGE